jgi:hypothetical protein
MKAVVFPQRDMTFQHRDLFGTPFVYAYILPHAMRCSLVLEKNSYCTLARPNIETPVLLSRHLPRLHATRGATTAQPSLPLRPVVLVPGISYLTEMDSCRLR